MPELSTLACAAVPPAPKLRRVYAVVAGPSAIDGTGAFAAEPVPPRAKIGEIRGEPISVPQAQQRARRGGRLMLVEVSAGRAVDASGSTDPLRFANHSCAPNAALRIQRGRIEIYAQRNIAPGEEITLDYGETHHRGTLACRCGAPQCRGSL